jgi:hypothetical protein
MNFTNHPSAPGESSRQSGGTTSLSDNPESSERSVVDTDSVSVEVDHAGESIEPVEVAEDDHSDFYAEVEDEYETGEVRYRGATNDPIFGYLIGLALSVGLSPLIANGNIELRYTLVWGVLAIFGVLAYLFGSSARISEEALDNAVWGVSFGLILSAPMLAFGGTTLNTAVALLFRGMSTGAVLAYLVFVMPLAETLFFRAVLQEHRPFWLVSLMATFWSCVLFFPLMDLNRYPLVAFVICLTLLMMNLIYGYVRQRNGLAAAWVCQIVVNLVLVFLPFVSQ